VDLCCRDQNCLWAALRGFGLAANTREVVYSQVAVSSWELRLGPLAQRGMFPNTPDWPVVQFGVRPARSPCSVAEFVLRPANRVNVEPIEALAGQSRVESGYSPTAMLAERKGSRHSLANCCFARRPNRRGFAFGRARRRELPDR
jgi:hypothetical protein